MYVGTVVAESDNIPATKDQAGWATGPGVLNDELELLANQAQLEQAAEAVRWDLALEPRLAEIGDPVLVGSAALRVMVRRDIDVTTICADLSAATAEAITSLAATWARHPRVRSVHIRDDTGLWNIDQTYPDGWYIGVEYRSQQGEEWTLDFWFVAEPQRQPDLLQLRRALPMLTDEHRTAIITIKRARSSRPEHPPGLSSRIYDAVLEHDVQTVEQFDRWLAASP